MLNVYEEARRSATDAREEQMQEITILNAMKSTEVQTLGVMAAVYALRMTLC